MVYKDSSNQTLRGTSEKSTYAVHPIRLPFTIPAGQYTAVERFVYAYLIETARGTTFIDTGVSASFETLRHILSTLPGGVSSLRQIVLTHSHPDHIGAAARIAELGPVLVFAHSDEVGWIEDVGRQKRERPVPGFDGLVSGSIRVTDRLNDNDCLDIGGVNLKVLHTPGHSPGSISLYIETEGVLFSGDAVAQPGAVPIYTDVDASIRSLQRLMALPNLRVLYAAWDEPRFDKAAYDALETAFETIQSIHRIVMETDRALRKPDLMDLCAACVEKLGFPPFAVNPLTAATFEAHRRATLLPRY